MIKILKLGSITPQTPGGTLLHTIKVYMIASVVDGRKIGYDNHLLVRNSEDLKHFQETTEGHLIVMGRQTFVSIGCTALPNRMNFVLTRSSNSTSNTDHKNLKFGQIQHLLRYCIANQISEIYVIGGDSVYSEFIDFADVLILTHFKSSDSGILKEFENRCNKFFPAYNNNWVIKYTKTPITDKFQIKYYYRRENTEKYVFSDNRRNITNY